MHTTRRANHKAAPSVHKPSTNIEFACTTVLDTKRASEVDLLPVLPTIYGGPNDRPEYHNRPEYSAGQLYRRGCIRLYAVGARPVLCGPGRLSANWRWHRPVQLWAVLRGAVTAAVRHRRADRVASRLWLHTDLYLRLSIRILAKLYLSTCIRCYDRSSSTGRLALCL